MYAYAYGYAYGFPAWLPSGVFPALEATSLASQLGFPAWLPSLAGLQNRVKHKGFAKIAYRTV